MRNWLTLGFLLCPSTWRRALPELAATSLLFCLGCASSGGPAHFQAAKSVAVGNQPNFVTSGDFDSDGHLDLAVANYGSATVSVLRGDGQGGFATPTDFAVGTWPSTLAI